MHERDAHPINCRCNQPRGAVRWSVLRVRRGRDDV